MEWNPTDRQSIDSYWLVLHSLSVPIHMHRDHFSCGIWLSFCKRPSLLRVLIAMILSFCWWILPNNLYRACSLHQNALWYFYKSWIPSCERASSAIIASWINNQHSWELLCRRAIKVRFHRTFDLDPIARSEERRVGKECRL